ncbi:MAG TPA: EF-P beta-lysylation protein EpmB [Nevskiaceae bacterium]|nr:EF-P beta-lysylation protein EpmB [Nevskiaceae bacterium]
MIPRPLAGSEPAPRAAPRWQHRLRESLSDPAELLALLGLDPALPTLQAGLAAGFPLRVTRSYVARMRRGDPRDPLFLQVWPRPDEASGEITRLDAVGDLQVSREAGVIHKYQGRVLLIATGACAIHCRYCFRRHFPYSEQLAARGQWRAALETIASDPAIEEVILSGGDPLSLSDDKLAELAQSLEAIPHLRRLRLHTRQPVVLPERVDEGLLSWLGRGRLATSVVLHINHAQEIDEDLAAACGRLRAQGITLLNQAVLLAGINDSTDALAALSARLFEVGVLPYYLHLLDRVQGVGHFEVDERRATGLMRELAARLPGYLVPRLAREVSGEPAKRWIAW